MTTQRARRHFLAGKRAFEAKRYAVALKEFEAGYAIDPRPGFLLNMGHAARRMGELRRARDYYLKFLESDPPGDRAPHDDRAGHRDRSPACRGVHRGIARVSGAWAGRGHNHARRGARQRNLGAGQAMRIERVRFGWKPAVLVAIATIAAACGTSDPLTSVYLEIYDSSVISSPTKVTLNVFDGPGGNQIATLDRTAPAQDERRRRCWAAC